MRSPAEHLDPYGDVSIASLADAVSGHPLQGWTHIA
jgi:hypothetical protein